MRDAAGPGSVQPQEENPEGSALRAGGQSTFFQLQVLGLSFILVFLHLQGFAVTLVHISGFLLSAHSCVKQH